MGKYLDKFKSTIPAVQGRQIFQLLNGMKDAGNIRSVNEYNQKLQELSEHLRGTSPQPLSKFFTAFVGNLIDSDRFNAMVKAIGFDLETIFQEADNIATVLDLHKSLYKLTVLTALEKGVDDLEDLISLYEFMNRDINGFSQAQYNTFRNNDKRIIDRRANPGLFFDLRRNELTTGNDDCQVDLYGQQLILPSSFREELKAVDIELLSDAETTQSFLDVQQVTSSLKNVIDRQKYTYWVYPILVNEDNLSSLQTAGGARIKVCVDLGGVRQVNKMEIEPASPLPMILESVSYTGVDNATHNINLNVSVNRNTSVSLGSIETQYIILTFLQESYEEVDYHYNPEADIWERVWRDDLDPEEIDTSRINRLAEDLRITIPDSSIREILDIPDSSSPQRVSAYQYTFGFDNIRFFQELYRGNGIFVGERFNVDSPGLLALHVDEYNPTVTIGNNEYNEFSFEYTLLKTNLSANGAYLDQEIVPILPIEYNGTIENERLFLVYRHDAAVNNTAVLRFTPNIWSQTPVVRKNLSDILVIGDPNDSSTDYVARAEGQSSWQQDWDSVKTFIDSNSASGAVPMRVYIKFLNPSIHGVYTVSYRISTRNSENPSASASARTPRHLTERIVLQDDHILRTEPTESPIARSEIYLLVCMRNNYIYDTSTAALREYKLLASKFDANKYMESE